MEMGDHGAARSGWCMDHVSASFCMEFCVVHHSAWLYHSEHEGSAKEKRLAISVTLSKACVVPPFRNNHSAKSEDTTHALPLRDRKNKPDSPKHAGT
jgi:hypothetical protein